MLTALASKWRVQDQDNNVRDIASYVRDDAPPAPEPESSDETLPIGDSSEELNGPTAYREVAPALRAGRYTSSVGLNDHTASDRIGAQYEHGCLGTRMEDEGRGSPGTYPIQKSMGSEIPPDFGGVVFEAVQEGYVGGNRVVEYRTGDQIVQAGVQRRVLNAAAEARSSVLQNWMTNG